MKRLIEETACEHGNYGACGHQPLDDGECAIRGCGDPSHSCRGGSSREVTLEGLQKALDSVIENLLPAEHRLTIDVEQLIAMELET